jgi:hypothetical protein
MDREFRIGDRKFKLNKIDALRQFHIVRRIAPLLREMIPVMGSIKKAKVDDLTEEQKFEQFGLIASPIIEGLARLSDADADFVLFRLLASVEVEQPQFNSWTFIATESGIKMQDMDLPVLLQAAGRALMFNLSGFFASLPRVS